MDKRLIKAIILLILFVPLLVLVPFEVIIWGCRWIVQNKSFPDSPLLFHLINWVTE
jgi:hypothetical protein